MQSSGAGIAFDVVVKGLSARKSITYDMEPKL